MLGAIALQCDMSRLRKIIAHVLVCTHKTCRKQGGKRVAKEFKRALRERGLRRSVMLTHVKCLGQCGRGPVVGVYPAGLWYGRVDEDGARAMVEQFVRPDLIAAGPEVLCEMRAPGEKRP